MTVHRRGDGDEMEALLAEDDELKKLREIARFLSGVRITARAAFRDQLARRLSGGVIRDPQPKLRGGARWRSWHHRTWAAVRAAAGLARGVPAAVTVLAAFLVVILATNVPEVEVASAAEILNRSDLALSRLVHRDEVLYRQWRAVSTAWPNGAAASSSERVRIQHEWMDGAYFNRVAGRWYDTDGQLLVAYATAEQEGELRPQVYLATGVYGEPQGALHLEPTQEEFERALEDFPQAQRAALGLILNRHYIYMPIAGERGFNRLLIEERETSTPALPRFMLSFDERVVDEQPVYRVRIVDPVRIRFHWRAEGPPAVQRSRAEIVRFIAKGSFLSLRSEEAYEFEDGRRTFTVRELIEMRPMSVADLQTNPFRLDDVPEGTTRRRQSAEEWLTEVASALSEVARSPARR